MPDSFCALASRRELMAKFCLLLLRIILSSHGERVFVVLVLLSIESHELVKGLDVRHGRSETCNGAKKEEEEKHGFSRGTKRKMP